jgi:Cu-Zn family superoxide dismutase
MYVNKDGAGRYEALLESITLGAGETSIFDSDGSAILIHATADDNMTDPAGNSGDRIACGVIAKAAAKKRLANPI